jgi:hypothetical protein
MADVFRLTKAITAVTFSPEGRASLSALPVDAQLCLTGQSSLTGFIDVTYNDKVYCIFRVDLMARSVTLETMRAAAEICTRSELSSPPLVAPVRSRQPRASFRRPFGTRQVSAGLPG